MDFCQSSSVEFWDMGHENSFSNFFEIWLIYVTYINNIEKLTFYQFNTKKTHLDPKIKWKYAQKWPYFHYVDTFQGVLLSHK